MTDTGKPVRVALRAVTMPNTTTTTMWDRMCTASAIRCRSWTRAEVYKKRTFSRDRYVSNVLNSFGHPVPRAAGQLQQTGRSAEAKVLKLDQTDDQDTLQLDLTSAYPVKTLKQLTRTFTFQRSTACLTVSDAVEFDAAEDFGTALITFDTWEQLSDGRLLVGKDAEAVQVQVDAGGLPVKITATTIDEDVRGRGGDSPCASASTWPRRRRRLSFASRSAPPKRNDRRRKGSRTFLLAEQAS